MNPFTPTTRIRRAREPGTPRRDRDVKLLLGFVLGQYLDVTPGAEHEGAAFAGAEAEVDRNPGAGELHGHGGREAEAGVGRFEHGPIRGRVDTVAVASVVETRLEREPKR